MLTAVRQTVTVQADGRLEVVAPELRAGTVTEVIVLVPASAALASAPSIGDRLAALKQLQDSLKLTPASAAAWMREVELEREARRIPGDEDT